jgi:hypothetical protein
MSLSTADIHSVWVSWYGLGVAAWLCWLGLLRMSRVFAGHTGQRAC